MKKYLFLFIALFCNELSSQVFEADQKHIGTSWTTPYGLYPMEDVFIMGGLAYFDSLDYRHMFMATYDYSCNLIHFDTIPEIDYLMFVFNDITYKDNQIFWMSIGSGRTIMYSYDWGENDLNTLDTLDSYLSDFNSKDYIVLDNDEYLFSGFFRVSNSNSDFGIIKVSKDSIIKSFREIDNSISANGERIFRKEEGEFLVHSYFNDTNEAKAILYRFDEDLNLLGRVEEKSELFKVHFATQLVDQHGDIVHSSLLVDEGRTGYKPMVTKLDTNGNVYWERVIGRIEQEFTLDSQWHGIKESNNKDGYIISGSALIEAPQRDTLLSYAVVAKLSLEGDSIWYRRFTSLDTNKAYHVFYDIIPHPEGGYIVAGFDDYWVPTPEGKAHSSIIIARIDEEGIPIGSFGTNSVIIDDEIKVEVYPNPMVDRIFITNNSGSRLSCSIITGSGRLVHSFDLWDSSESYIFNTKDLPQGLYYLQCRRDNQIINKKLVVVK